MLRKTGKHASDWSTSGDACAPVACFLDIFGNCKGISKLDTFQETYARREEILAAHQGYVSSKIDAFTVGTSPAL